MDAVNHLRNMYIYSAAVMPERKGWLLQEADKEQEPPVWSRLLQRNNIQQPRKLQVSKCKKFDIEAPHRLYSLWGSLRPDAGVFDVQSRGKQYLACSVLTCCAALLYPVMNWTPQLLDTIIINGDRYYRESLANIERPDFEFSLEDLNTVCKLENMRFEVHVANVSYGQLYNSPQISNSMNLAKALMQFFRHNHYGILLCQRRTLSIGHANANEPRDGFFMYDCQSRDYPLFPQGQGSSYLLHCKRLQTLLYCIVVTLNVQLYNVQFSLHKVEPRYDGISVNRSFRYTEIGHKKFKLEDVNDPEMEPSNKIGMVGPAELERSIDQRLKH